MKVYLAAPYASREKIAGYAGELVSMGVNVQAQWLTETHEIDDEALGPASRFDDSTIEEMVTGNFADIGQADVVVVFTEKVAGVPGLSGGRHVEAGYALAKSKAVVLVGEPENVFYRSARVTRCSDWHAAVIELARRLAAGNR
ncbi:MAG: hypothetical protein ACRD0W_10370 [Acidimicrobiales bacterium]